MMAEKKVQGIKMDRFPVLRNSYVSLWRYNRMTGCKGAYLSATNGGKILPSTLAAFKMISR